MDTVFAPELAGLDREEIRRWYNGYNWLGESVYNPFDVLLLFRGRVFVFEFKVMPDAATGEASRCI